MYIVRLKTLTYSIVFSSALRYNHKAVRIPLIRAHDRKRVIPVAEEPIPRVLIVDDDPGFLKLAEVLIGRAGMEAIFATTAAEAAQVLRNMSRDLPDLVILDMMLPDVSGIEFLRQMREKSIFDDLPVLILSALGDPNQIRQALATGADRYLTKTFVANNLIPTVQDLLATGRKRLD